MYAFLTMLKTIRQIFVLGLGKLVVIHVHIDERAGVRAYLYYFFSRQACFLSLEMYR